MASPTGSNSEWRYLSTVGSERHENGLDFLFGDVDARSTRRALNESWMPWLAMDAIMVAKIDLPEGRRRIVIIGTCIAAEGLILFLRGQRATGIAVAVLGSAYALWAVLHKSRGLPVELSQACRWGRHEACLSRDHCVCECHWFHDRATQ